MRLGKLKHMLKYWVECSDLAWDRRQKAIELLDQEGYRIEILPNPRRLKAYKDGEGYIIDVDETSLFADPLGGAEQRSHCDEIRKLLFPLRDAMNGGQRHILALIIANEIFEKSKFIEKLWAETGLVEGSLPEIPFHFDPKLLGEIESILRDCDGMNEAEYLEQLRERR